MRFVVPYSFYTRGNTGDEATLQGLARLIAQCGLPVKSAWVGSKIPQQLALIEPSFSYFHTGKRDLRRIWAKLTGDGYAIVGGTPIQDVLGDWPFNQLAPVVGSVARRKRPLVFLGVGVESLHCGGKRQQFRRDFDPHVIHWTPRSSRGRDHLVEYGVSADRITVAADVAWLLESCDSTFGQERLRTWGFDPGRPLLGVNIAAELFAESPTLTEAMATALDAWIDASDGQVAFFVNDVSEVADRDLAAAISLTKNMRRTDRARPVPNEYFSPQQMMSLIGCCEQTISMHYHFCVYSALQGIPFFTIHNTDKVVDLCSEMEMRDSVVAPACPAATLADRVVHLRQNLSSARDQLRGTVGKMRALAAQNVVALRALVAK